MPVIWLTPPVIEGCGEGTPGTSTAPPARPPRCTRCSGRTPSVTLSPTLAAPPSTAATMESPPGSETRKPPVSALSTSDVTKFMAGEPMKPATKRFCGWW